LGQTVTPHLKVRTSPRPINAAKPDVFCHCGV